MKSIRFLFIWAFLVFLLPFGAQAQGAGKVVPPDEFFPVYNFHYDWLVFNNQYNDFVPFSQGLNEDSRSVSVYVDLVKNRRYSLLFKTENEGYLFLEGALQRRIAANKWVQFNIDSLYRIYKKDELLFTVYGSSGILDKTLLICNKKTANGMNLMDNPRASFINIRPVAVSPFGNFAILASMIILIICGWVFNTDPLSFERLVNPIEFFNNSPRDQLSKVNKPYSSNVVFFVLGSSMLMSFILVFLTTQKINLFSVDTILSEQNGTLQFLGDFFLISILFFLLTYGKYILMVMVGNVLNLDKLVDTLFLKIVQSSYLFHAGLFLLVFMLSFNHAPWMESWRPYILLPFLFFYSVRFLALYVVVKPAGTLINLYLFSYLCVIEVIPLIIGIKFAL
ncbi:hypothetical protein DYBT9275_00731 [Dyadobacter sp. CECT 9275]|uniref:DUF4271 domain-containing protein n=1 Tax=Dyadobacter helix TaxID=2822344 RepID=A0A916JAM7_9BACT|nr:DUF4271 domain-containing protein [Dyadobacter sp. CECT 9275]CAG4991346.1 hypothetical protein DYBT9275_00731 [Dyadobacter sp. CECT 9275]